MYCRDYSNREVTFLRRTFVCILLCLLLCLSACGGEDNAVSTAIEFRAALVQANGCSFQAEIEADLGKETQRFTVSCDFAADGTAKLTLLAPETISGITATVTENGGKITYDGIAVDFGLLANGEVVPAAAPAIVAQCWASEYISAAGYEEELCRVTYEKGFDEKTLLMDTWFENEVPICAEVCYNQNRILRLTISDFHFH